LKNAETESGRRQKQTDLSVPAEEHDIRERYEEKNQCRLSPAAANSRRRGHTLLSAVDGKVSNPVNQLGN
jgi:hypothetical protein